ncbi:glycosyltransferase [Chitinophaga lutea]|uniref:Glycosyltransferase n=1 Tax=Chitinophaga lutea TaxID=2488634 RepID=A0A3N4PHD5_9BACT|nr:glycosyltransferase [Chitinophaga lutea]RPE05979.1 glycosyltransferase [Chitinophaga lutea]
MTASIDVIIPSFRPDERYLLPVLRLKRPAGTDIRFYLVIDDPGAAVPDSIRGLVDNQTVFLLINDKNLGAAGARNRGIAASSGEWLLLLDDDVLPDEVLLEAYAHAIKTFSTATGFIGLVRFPEACSRFCEAVLASGSMDIFSIAERRPTFAWAATANVMVRRRTMGEIRFSSAFPASGGGEDVDFFLNLMTRNKGQRLYCVPGAAVEHPWWNNGRPGYKRPFRYGIGNSLLGTLHPQFTYYDFLNTPETLLLLCLLLPVPGWTVSVLVLMGGVLCIELIANAVQVLKRYPGSSAAAVYYTALLRLAQDTGVLWGKLRRGQFFRIGERFHDDGRIQKINFYHSNTYRTVKWLLYPVLAIAVAMCRTPS